MADTEKYNQIKTEEIIDSLDKGQRYNFHNEFTDLHVYEQAEIFTTLDKEQRQRVYQYLTPKELSDTFDAIEDDPEEAVKYFDEMSLKYVAELLDNMYTDNEVDLLGQLDKHKLAKYLGLMDKDKANEIKALLHYEDKTAGAIMSTDFASIVSNQTVSSAMQVLREEAGNAETIYYDYVVNNDKRLLGIVTLRNLLMSDETALIGDIMTTPVMSVKADDDQEDVAKMIRDYNFLAMPVTNYDEQLIGVITVDDIIDVIDEESAEDYSGLAGVDTEEQTENPFKAASKRLPWLITLLFLGMSTASLVSHFEGLLSEASILAVFISLITGTAGNAGTQSLAVAVRRLAVKDDTEQSVVRLIISEVFTGLVIGVVTGIAVTLIVGIWKGNFVLGMVIGLAMMSAITVANLAGSFIPILMDKIGVDPAVASGPFISTLSDLTSVLIYFSIAQVFLKFFITS
ncbi:magnesium transporter [Dellaglioa algida]|uniref:Magnesium transporter MgtE n=2 Tax=Dellaglioa algida TaxID=105612 RepID=A0A0R1HQC7_9LACO|nr:magnesium transporter [Dellaglioa algida]KRK45370.1 Mg2+ transporter [Dellaglioa algida DSM 15638]MDK1717251.1 magnesium transporter [Dellaglioa algida]MDK1719155.1 magnesium transporter [Dellaglioa algida]MDK1720500.1 magnesium transporter [Dellaglioa algida]MDK1722193.1 magnesium transporter [Dellaglioa algida]